jgi:hypothetical protein
MAESNVTPSGKSAAEARTRMPPAIPSIKSRSLPALGNGPEFNAAEIQRMIAEAAYYLAEKRNFAPGFEEEDWATATTEVMAQISLASL